MALPSFTGVQYALTNSSRLTSLAPNVSEGVGSNFDLMPISWAVLTILLIPTSCPSRTATLLTLIAKACFSEMLAPENLPSALVGAQVTSLP